MYLVNLQYWIDRIAAEAKVANEVLDKLPETAPAEERLDAVVAVHLIAEIGRFLAALVADSLPVKLTTDEPAPDPTIEPAP